MIKKVGNKYAVFSHRTGRRLSRFYNTKKEALKRLKQIVFFKNLKKLPRQAIKNIRLLKLK